MTLYDELFRDSPATPREEQLLDRLSELHLNYAYALDFRNDVVRALRESANRGLSTPILHDCAGVERDAIDLHAALAEAIKRLSLANEFLTNPHHVGDLLEVLDRTSRPDIWKLRGDDGVFV